VAQRRLAARAMGRKMVSEEPDRARQMGVGRPDLKEAFDAELVDLNSAPASAIASVCGVSSATAQRIVDARAGTEGFSSVEDMDLLLNLPPAEVARLHDAAVCVPVD
jgi:DNA uptake protein ComE-like DNA-binding protein